MQQTTMHTFVTDDNLTVRDLPYKTMNYPIHSGEMVQLTEPDVDGVRLAVLNERSLLDLLRVQPRNITQVELYFPRDRVIAVDDCKLPVILNVDHPNLEDQSVKSLIRISTNPGLYLGRSVHDGIRTSFYIANGECVRHEINGDGVPVYSSLTKNEMKQIGKQHIGVDEVWEAEKVFKKS